jgi:hypothetical protein
MAYSIRTLGPSESFKTQYGEMLKYTVQFEGSEDWVQINQKPDSPAPKVGDTLEGTIETTQYGKRFKKAQGPGGFTGGRQNDPETRGSIERQSALKVASEAVYNWHMLNNDEHRADLDTYMVEIITTAKKFQAHLGNVNPQTTVKVEEDLPPASNYENMQ